MINYRDCGAANTAYGADKVANPQSRPKRTRPRTDGIQETLGERQPTLAVELNLMALDGKVETFFVSS